MTEATDIETIRRALQADEFFLVYQPIITLDDHRCVGAEALIRWRRGNVVTDAGDFIPQTDKTPLSGTITYWVMDTVANELGRLARRATATHLIGINVPPEILGRGGIEYVANKSGLRAHAKQLVFEITERGVPDQLGLDALNSIPTTGARVALDDTTLSGANLALLTRCHFDFVKIDRTLVAQLNGAAKQPQWLNGLAALLAFDAVAGDRRRHRTGVGSHGAPEAGVQLAQGHLFSPPLRADEFKRYYAESHRPREPGAQGARLRRDAVESDRVAGNWLRPSAGARNPTCGSSSGCCCRCSRPPPLLGAGAAPPCSRPPHTPEVQHAHGGAHASARTAATTVTATQPCPHCPLDAGSRHVGHDGRAS